MLEYLFLLKSNSTEENSQEYVHYLVYIFGLQTEHSPLSNC